MDTFILIQNEKFINIFKKSRHTQNICNFQVYDNIVNISKLIFFSFYL